MRIAYVTETFPPEINGVALTAERAVVHLRGAGHAVQLLRPRQRGEDPRDDVAEWRTPGGPLPMYPDLRFGWARAGALKKRWRHWQPDLVHLATPGPLAWSALHAASALDVPVTAEFRTNFHAYSRHYRLGWLEPVVLGALRRLHAGADLNFVPTRALAAQLGTQGFERLEVVGRGVDAGRFSPSHRSDELRRAWGASTDEPVLLHVGRLAAEKNVGLALQAFETLRATRPGLRMVVVGDGPLRERWQAMHPQVHFVGVRRGEDLARHYASADVFLFPSLTDTFGNVTMEALASGLAIAAFDTAAAAEHVADGVSGCLARPGDQAGFVDAARRAVERAAPDGALRRRAREAALRADWDVVLRGFEQCLCDVISERMQRRLRDAALAWEPGPLGRPGS